MKTLVIACVLALSVACGGVQPALPTDATVAAAKDRALIAIGEASAALETAEEVSARVRAQVQASNLPDRVTATILPALDEFDAAVAFARTKVDGVYSMEALDIVMAPVVSARTKLATLLRLYDALSAAEDLLALIPARGR